ncbi:ATP-binding protein [Candidatus Competibacter phosphatis]|uniref:ATP-binding protein n=1 Tax=Candidatus Competibacter phosphatis TaxID=221280 RepID=A0ABX1TJ19_9GAMM|nr:ATP-binding protein [Candidatus Competibacter phosphatis]
MNDCIARAIQVVLLIDDAHHLQKEALDGLLSLSRFEFARGRTIQVVLSGIPVLEEILSETKIFSWQCSRRYSYFT